jgi:predicted AAA+ superfamily ATPase
MVSRKIVENYFSILEDLLLGFYLFPFNKRAQRQVVHHPKFYFFDAGVFQTLRPKGPFDQNTEIAGAALETLFIQEWRALNDYLGAEYQAYYWRTTNGLEIDFIFYGPRGLLAFEIKRSKNLKPADFKALRLFGADYPEAKLYLLYGGERREYHDKVTVLPFVDTLRSLSSIMNNTFDTNH